MKLLIVDDEYIAVEGVMNGVNWDSLGFEQVFQAYSYAEAVGGVPEQLCGNSALRH